jgi:hypothetical protein
MGWECADQNSLISQSYTWSRLSICEEHFRMLFTRLKVHPDFLDIVRVFCEKTGPVEESFSDFFVKISPRSLLNDHSAVNGASGYGKGVVYSMSTFTNRNLELGYNIKYVAPHGRDYPKDPFSIREVGVYQRYDPKTQRSSWIFLQVPEDLKRRLASVFQHTKESTPMSQFQIHTMVLLSVSEAWRDYLVYLEEQFSNLVDRGFFTSINGPKLETDISADFSDIRRVQILTDKLRRLVQILKLNTRLGHQFKKSIAKMENVTPPDMHPFLNNLDLELDKFIFQQETHLSRIEALIARAQGIGQLVSSCRRPPKQTS